MPDPRGRPSRIPAASPEAGEAAAAMSARHGWLRFRSTGVPLSVGLDDDVLDWQDEVLAGHRHWYGSQAPAQVSDAFVLQYLVQVPAHTAATAADVGLRVHRLSELSFERGSGGVPRMVELTDLVRDHDDLEGRLTRAQSQYREVAGPLALGYRPRRRMSSRQRLGMVQDLWEEAARAVRAAHGRFPVGAPRRLSCCLIYALPGCVECAGCPRRPPASGAGR